PLTQAVLALTAERPRKCAVVPVGVFCHAYPGFPAAAGAAPRRSESPASSAIRFTAPRNLSSFANGHDGDGPCPSRAHELRAGPAARVASISFVRGRSPRSSFATPGWAATTLCSISEPAPAG